MSVPHPVQEFFSIGEVCQLTDLKPHVLRYWESQFRFLNPAKNRSGNRVYQRREIELIMLVKHLLYTEKYTIEGARQKIEQYRRSGELKPEARRALATETVKELRAELKSVLGMHPRNRGKGNALRTGIAKACALGASIIVTIDADGQHPPEEIPRLLSPIAEGRAALVLGARQRNRAMPLSRRFTNWLSASLASCIGGQQVRDAQTGFRAFTRELAERVQPVGDRYEFEANFLLDALRAG